MTSPESSVVSPTCLTQLEAETILKKVGPNSLPSPRSTGYFSRVLKIAKEPMLLLLIITSIIYFIVGDLSESLMLLFSVFVVVGISLYQDQKSEKALQALKKMSSPRALVVRDHIEKRISSVEVVPGDLIVLHEGDRVPVDGFVLQSTHLVLDESLITGEAFPVKKSSLSTNEKETSFESAENHVKVFSSTLVVAGSAYVRSVRTGVETEVGKIGKSLDEVESDPLNLSREVGKFVRIFGWIGFGICIVLILLYGLLRNEWLEAILMGIATQMALLPEEFPVVLTIFMAMGAWRLSKLKVLVRTPVAIERLGAITTLCVDKTGTLTENKMRVAALGSINQIVHVNAESKKNLPENFHELIEYAIMASHRDPFDPMEKAILNLTQNETWAIDHLHPHWNLVREYPLSDQLLAMSCVWKPKPASNFLLIAAKGAPESVMDLCHIDSETSAQITKTTKEMASHGMRVLGVAKAKFCDVNLPNQQHDFSFEWIGLIGLEDPLRPEVPAAIQLCRRAGIRVIMMTGDYKETAYKIAKEAGIATSNTVISGAELSHMTDEELKTRMLDVHVFARMIPEQKLRILKALKELGQVVGMTGDGVNDAPSLKWADVGIAMGSRGTDVAREASDIVLLDDNFTSIVSGIKQGRTIYANIKKAMSYIIAIHVPIAGLSILPLFFGWPLILLPAHIVFLELIIDPACSLVFESPQDQGRIMEEKPRALNSSFFSRQSVLRSFLQGALILVATSFLFWMGLKISNNDQYYARSLTFAMLVLGNMILIFTNLTSGSFTQAKNVLRKKSNRLTPVAILIFLLLVFKIEFARKLFQLGPLNWFELLSLTGATATLLVATFIWDRITESRKIKLVSAIGDRIND